MSVNNNVTIRNELVVQLMRSNGKRRIRRLDAGRDLSSNMKSVRPDAPSVRKAVDSSVVSALILTGLSDASDPAGSSTLPTRSRASRGFSFFPEKKDANAAADDGNN